MPKKPLTDIQIIDESPKPTLGRPREWTEGLIEQKRKQLEKWIDNKNNYFFTTYLNEADLHPEQIERFCNYSEHFRETYARALKIQEARLVELAVSRKGDGNFIKFIMANKCGWKEKSEVSGDGVNPLAIIMAKIADSAKDPLDYDG
jgi:hypothetical protein